LDIIVSREVLILVPCQRNWECLTSSAFASRTWKTMDRRNVECLVGGREEEVQSCHVEVTTVPSVDFLNALCLSLAINPPHKAAKQTLPLCDAVRIMEIVYPSAFKGKTASRSGHPHSTLTSDADTSRTERILTTFQTSILEIPQVRTGSSQCTTVSKLFITMCD